ncbi:hypothetical protein LIER_13606 [Lithospermum erythrorhizon]|uniref:Retrotransposon gag domain-containing protein n=1 Tax=Lithospermum erythrorhizon TaxID=34254 RepID=A0AAV3PY95_LITER
MVKSWLVNSMEQHVNKKYLFYKTAKQIWDGAKDMYSDSGNTSQISELRKKMKALKQGNLSVTKYFSKLQYFWTELDSYTEDDPLCPDCTTKVHKKTKKERVYDFLAGLNTDLDEAKGRLISKNSVSIH